MPVETRRETTLCGQSGGGKETECEYGMSMRSPRGHDPSINRINSCSPVHGTGAVMGMRLMDSSAPFDTWRRSVSVGVPDLEMMSSSCSRVEEPLNMGFRPRISAKMHPIRTAGR